MVGGAQISQSGREEFDRRRVSRGPGASEGSGERRSGLVGLSEWVKKWFVRGSLLNGRK